MKRQAYSLKPGAELNEVADAITRYSLRRHLPATDEQVRDQIEELKTCIEILTHERAERGKALPFYAGLPRIDNAIGS